MPSIDDEDEILEAMPKPCYSTRMRRFLYTFYPDDVKAFPRMWLDSLDQFEQMTGGSSYCPTLTQLTTLLVLNCFGVYKPGDALFEDIKIILMTLAIQLAEAGRIFCVRENLMHRIEGLKSVNLIKNAVTIDTLVSTGILRMKNGEQQIGFSFGIFHHFFLAMYFTILLDEETASLESKMLIRSHFDPSLYKQHIVLAGFTAGLSSRISDTLVHHFLVLLPLYENEKCASILFALSESQLPVDSALLRCWLRYCQQQLDFRPNYLLQQPRIRLLSQLIQVISCLTSTMLNTEAMLDLMVVFTVALLTEDSQQKRRMILLFGPLCRISGTIYHIIQELAYTDHDPSVRLAGVKILLALSEHNFPQLVRLVNRLTDPDLEVRMTIAERLQTPVAQHGSLTLLAHSFTKNESVDVQFSAWLSLATCIQMGNEREDFYYPLFAVLMNNSKPENFRCLAGDLLITFAHQWRIFYRLVMIMDSIQPQEFQLYLCGRLFDKNTGNRLTSHTTELQQIAKCDKHTTLGRMIAITALDDTAYLGGISLMHPLIQWVYQQVKSDHPVVTIMALGLMTRWSSVIPRFVDDIPSYFEDQGNSLVCRVHALFLSRKLTGISAERKYDILYKAISALDPVIRSTALIALGPYVNINATIFILYLMALNDPEPCIRFHAASTLSHLKRSNFVDTIELAAFYFQQSPHEAVKKHFLFSLIEKSLHSKMAEYALNYLIFSRPQMNTHFNTPWINLDWYQTAWENYLYAAYRLSESSLC